MILINKSAARFARAFGLAGTITGLTFLSTVANAVPLPPGGSVALGGTTMTGSPYLGGTIIQDVYRSFYFMLPNGQVINGQVEDRIVRESGTGYLDFYFRIITNKNLQGNTMQVIRDSYAGDVGLNNSTVNVNYRLDDLGVQGPNSATRSSDGSKVSFLFQHPAIGSGSSGSTRFTFVHTQAMNYSVSGSLQTYFNGAPAFVMKVFKPVN